MNNSQSTSVKSTAIKKRSSCPISSVLDILGDKWTLLVVRDLFIGLTTFSDFQDSPEKIPTNILSDRLKRLEQEGIISKTKYQEHPVRYNYGLTEKGQKLGPVLQEIMKWGSEYLSDIASPEDMKKIASERLSKNK